MSFVDGMIAGAGEIVRSPFKSVDALWLIIPLLLMWAILEVYFAKYKKEQLGWNTALANGITLGWLTLEGMRHLFSTTPTDFLFRFLANIAILLYAALIIYFSFTHKLKSRWNFILAAPTPVYFLGIFSVVWGYGTLQVNRYVIVDLLILFIIINIVLNILRRFVKTAKEDVEEPGLKKEESGLPPLGDEKGPGEGGLGELPPLGGKGPAKSPGADSGVGDFSSLDNEKGPDGEGGFGELPPL